MLVLHTGWANKQQTMRRRRYECSRNSSHRRATTLEIEHDDFMELIAPAKVLEEIKRVLERPVAVDVAIGMKSLAGIRRRRKQEKTP